MSPCPELKAAQERIRDLKTYLLLPHDKRGPQPMETGMILGLNLASIVISEELAKLERRSDV